MEYITVREVAQKWKISQRLAQKYCTDGRIEGAKKFGGAWAIPPDAQKPTDPRRAAKVPPPPPASAQPAPVSQAACMTPMPLMNAAFVPGRCQAYVAAISDPRLRDIAHAEYYYFSGQA